MLKVNNLSIQEKRIIPTASLDKFVTLMDKHGFPSGYGMLPKNAWHSVSFELLNTNVGLANAIRRVLVEENSVVALSIEETDILSDDEFILGMNDVLVKNISLLPIYQRKDLTNLDIHLSKFNDTNAIIDIKASDFLFDEKSNKSKKSETSKNDSRRPHVNPLFPEDNIVIVRLRPGKYIKLKNISIVTGKAIEDAGKFTMLNNIKYRPLDIEPYNQFTSKGTRSIEFDCKNFFISFDTRGTITPKQVIDATVDTLLQLLTDFKTKIELYNNSPPTAFYSGQDCTVDILDSVYTYKLPGHYLTSVNMIAMQCYRMDESIPMCAAAVERFDTRIGIIRIKHANPNQLIIASIDQLIKELSIITDAF